MDANIDLLTFALTTHYFGVIMMEESGDSSCDTENNHGDGSQQAEIHSKLLASGEPAVSRHMAGAYGLSDI